MKNMNRKMEDKMKNEKTNENAKTIQCLEMVCGAEDEKMCSVMFVGPDSDHH